MGSPRGAGVAKAMAVRWLGSWRAPWLSTAHTALAALVVARLRVGSLLAQECCRREACKELGATVVALVQDNMLLASKNAQESVAIASTDAAPQAATESEGTSDKLAQRVDRAREEARLLDAEREARLRHGREPRGGAWDVIPRRQRQGPGGAHLAAPLPWSAGKWRGGLGLAHHMARRATGARGGATQHTRLVHVWRQHTSEAVRGEHGGAGSGP